MNYKAEIMAFYDWLETNPLPTSAIALWHAIANIATKTDRQQEFAVAISVLEAKTGLNAKAVTRARNQLAQSGLIKWKSRKGNQSALYELISLSDNLRDKNDSNFVPQPVRRMSYKVSNNMSHKVSILNNKEDDDKDDDNKKGLAAIAGFYEQNIGLVPPYVAHEIQDLLGRGVEDKLIVEALKISVANNARKWSYAKAVLSDCESKGIMTLKNFKAEKREGGRHNAKPSATVSAAPEEQYGTVL